MPCRIFTKISLREIEYLQYYWGAFIKEGEFIRRNTICVTLSFPHRPFPSRLVCSRSLRGFVCGSVLPGSYVAWLAWSSSQHAAYSTRRKDRQCPGKYLLDNLTNNLNINSFNHTHCHVFYC